MKRFVGSVLGLLVVGLIINQASGASAAAKKAAKVTSLTGEVIDSSCYLKGGMKGEAHKQCAEMCAKAGIPLALLTDDGRVYMVFAKKDMESAQPLLQGKEASRVKITGVVVKKGGVQAISAESVEAVQ